MSTISEMKKAQRGYLAAKSAIEMTAPKNIVIRLQYDTKDETGNAKTIYPGKVIYEPNNDRILIEDNCGCYHFYIDSDELPILIKALRELAE